jgi:hypothetical protein
LKFFFNLHRHCVLIPVKVPEPKIVFHECPADFPLAHKVECFALMPVTTHISLAKSLRVLTYGIMGVITIVSSTLTAAASK